MGLQADVTETSQNPIWARTLDCLLLISVLFLWEGTLETWNNGKGLTLREVYFTLIGFLGGITGDPVTGINDKIHYQAGDKVWCCLPFFFFFLLIDSKCNAGGWRVQLQNCKWIIWLGVLCSRPPLGRPGHDQDQRVTTKILEGWDQVEIKTKAGHDQDPSSCIRVLRFNTVLDTQKLSVKPF